MTRATHWVKPNHQCRIPKRWVSFDTETRTEKGENEDIQHWASGAAIKWRTDLKKGIGKEASTFTSAEDMWRWIDDFCIPEVRTVCVAHNLGFDVRISCVFDILPKLGWSLEWCNLDRNVSSMTWRSNHGTLVLCDLFTWIPKSLREIGLMVNLPKLEMPHANASKEIWDTYCMRDADIVHHAIMDLVSYVRLRQLGNWQPTGAGMAYSTWRHKFMTHRVLVHDNDEALSAERSAMHTGRAEAWRHGICSDGPYYEVDLRSAYTRIAAECELPTKYKFSHGRISLAQYEELSQAFRLLCKVTVCCDVPVVPFDNGQRTLWPIGEFATWLWDVEVNALLAENQSVRIIAVHAYTKHPALSDFALWVLSVMRGNDAEASEVVRAWSKHIGRALIGRLSLRVPSWKEYGANPYSYAGMSIDVDYATGALTRMMHVGDKTFIETDRVEGKDSLPQVTGWIMAECRVRLWEAMRTAGLDHIYHVDTDCVVVDKVGLKRMRQTYGAQFNYVWQVKSVWESMLVYGPRNLRAGRIRKVAGVPKSATEVKPNVFEGERWRGLAADMLSGRPTAVTIVPAQWEMKMSDPRRLDSESGGGRTEAIRIEQD